MLSKLRHAQFGDPITSVSQADIISFAASVGAAELSPVTGGTLGAVFLLRVDGRWRVAKTNALSSGDNALRREFVILQSLYGDRLGLDQRLIGGRYWLVMQALEHSPEPLGPKEVLQLNTWLSARLNTPAVIAEIPPHEDFGRLVVESERALNALVAGGHVGLETQNIVINSFGELARELPQLPVVVCHGDLSAANIMRDDHGPIVIDWEDAFWGIEGYDYLYWLTFMAQRPHYSSAMFGHTPWRREVEISVLIAIIVLKSWIAVLNGSHRQNSLGFDRRILEVAAFA